MPILVYILEVTICWAVLYLLFIACMRKETFFHINRWYLLTSLVAGLIIPLLRLIKFAPEIIEYNYQVVNSIPWAGEVRSAPHELVYSFQKSSTPEFNIELLIWLLYFTISVLFLSRFLKGLLKIGKLYRKGTKVNHASHTIIFTQEHHLPFSFFKNIFLSAQVDLGEDYDRILQHELEHVHALHTLDVIFIELIQIVFWFHPLIYFYKSSLRQTHEYIADAAAYDIDSHKIYGQLLLRQSLSGLETALVHHFFHSHIKKRINMIYQKKSGRAAWLKYALAVPALFVLTASFIAQDAHRRSHIVIGDNNKPLSEQNKRKLEKESVKVFELHKDDTDWNSLKNDLLDILNRWNDAHPESERDIRCILMEVSAKEKGLFFFYDKKRPDQLEPSSTFTFRQAYDEDESWPMPTSSDFRAELELMKYNESNRLSKILQIYSSYLPNYAKHPNLLKELDQAFHSFLKEEKIELGFEIEKLHPQFDQNLASVLDPYKELTRLDNIPIIWCQDHLLSRPIQESIDLDKPISMMVQLSAEDATKVFGNRGKLGFYILIEHELPRSHPDKQLELLKKEVNNFFTTIGQTHESGWASKLKTVHQALLKRYPHVKDAITPFTTIAHEYGINLIIKDKQIIKAYRSTKEGYQRLDGSGEIIRHKQGEYGPDTIIEYNPKTYQEKIIIKN